MAASTPGDQAYLALDGGVPAGDEEGIGVDGHEVGMRDAESFDRLVDHGSGVVDELLHGGCSLTAKTANGRL
jgi:hypothetical protein